MVNILEGLSRTDQLSAHDLCLYVIDVFERFSAVHIEQKMSYTVLLQRLHKAADALSGLRSHEPALHTTTRYLFDPYSAIKLNREQLQDDLARRVSVLRQFFGVAQHRINQLLAKKIRKGMTVLTHGYSSYVAHGLIYARQKRSFSVIVTESRPHLTGRRMATLLARNGIQVHLIVDAAARIGIKQADVVLFGVDAIDHDLKFYCPIGAELMAEHAVHRRVPVYAVTDSLKYDAHKVSSKRDVIKRADDGSIWKDVPDGVVVEYFGYEKINYSLIKAVISELGIDAPDRFSRKAKESYPEWFS